MGRHGSKHPRIETSADAVLRRLDDEFSAAPSAARDLARAHLRSLALVAMLAGSILAAGALFAPVLVALMGGLVVVTGLAMATVVEDEDGATGCERTRRWCRTRTRRIFGRRRRRPVARAQAQSTSGVPIASRVAPWLFPDPRKHC